MKRNSIPESPGLRQKAEERLKIRTTLAGKDVSRNVSTAAEALKLIHELDVHQVELEMQNEELLLAKEQAIIASEKYIELYDSAPSGYFTLSPKGEIIQLNLAGEAMLGKTRTQLINQLFHVYVNDYSKPYFLLFLEKVFSSRKKESCELNLSENVDIPMYVYITGIVAEKGGNCLITMIDITERCQAEADLRLSSEFNQLLLQTMPLGMDIVDEEGNILFMSESLKQHFGVVTLDKKCWELYRDDKKQCLECPLRSNIKTGETRITEAHGVFGGKIFEVSHTGMIYNGKKALLEIFNDITARKQAESNLEESEWKFRNIFENSPIGKSMTKLDGSLVVNKALCNILGYSTKELLTLKWQDITYPDDIEKTQNAIDSLVSGSKSKVRFEKRFIHKKGKLIWVDLSSSLQRDAKGKPLYLMSTMLDITGKKQTEALLRESEKKYHAIFNNVQDVFYQTDLAGTVLEVSPSIKHFSDFNRDEIIGKPVTNLYYDLNDRAELLDSLKKNGEISNYELRLKTRTGELRYVSNNARLVFDSDGKPNHINGEIKDITQRKLAEIELQASKDFLNNIKWGIRSSPANIYL